MNGIPESLVLIAGRADYPLLLARAARDQGVKHILAIAFKGETCRDIKQVVDEVIWLHVGSLGALLEALKKSGAPTRRGDLGRPMGGHARPYALGDSVPAGLLIGRETR